MKKCIWCLKDESSASFTSKAHSIPASLGGVDICNNVCDECNFYFGNTRENHFCIEETLKEAFNITRQRILLSLNTFQKPKQKSRFKSKYFQIKEKNGKYKLDIKRSFKLQPGFQSKLCHSFKRGIFKLYLEEIERQKGVGHDSKYDFIREFARYNIGDYPILYFERAIGIIFLLTEEAKNPKLYLNKMNYLFNGYGFTEIEFLGHVFGIPETRLWELEIESYLKESRKQKFKYFSSVKEIKYLTDIDFTLDIMNK